MSRAFPIHLVQGPPDGFPIEGDDVLAQVDEGIHPGDKSLLEALRVERRKDGPKRIVG